MKESFVGKSQPRKEDSRFLQGRGRYVGDIQLPRMVHVAFARSSYANARVLSIDTSRACAVPGVLAVLTAKDLATLSSLRTALTPPELWTSQVEHFVNLPVQPLLADSVVRFVGEAFALVVAENRYIAEDAVELIEAEFDSLPAVLNPLEAATDEGAWVHQELKTNVIATFRVAKGDPKESSNIAYRRIERRIQNHRYLALPMECRGVVAEFDDRSESLTVWSATQVAHWVKTAVAWHLNLPESRVRCIAPDVGGGFGLKGRVYAEEIIVPYLARLLRRPVCWIEDRQENLLNSTHSRDDVHDVVVAFDGEGRIVALTDRVTFDCGAYLPSGIPGLVNVPAHMCGPYHVPNFELFATAVSTNKAPNAPYRGTGRPEASFVIERLLDLIGIELGVDSVEIRKRNMIQPGEMPYEQGILYRDGMPIVYDSGDYPNALNSAIAAIGGLKQFRSKQALARKAEQYIGLGIACYVEGTGAGPFEGAVVRIDPGGGLVVATGACSSGQGHETVFAQVAADEWGLRPEDINVLISDTNVIATGFGSIASRTAVLVSAAIRNASRTLREKVLQIGAHLLECALEDVEYIEGQVTVKGTSSSLTLKQIAVAAYPGWKTNRPAGMSAGLEATDYFEPKTVTWAYGVHVAIVEICGQSGALKILQYVVAHDAGVLINPMIANGQIMGGVCQGIGGCLLEKVVYDSNGQNLTASLLDYLIPVAAQMPPITIVHTETPSTLNELGVKGLGEGGVVGPPGAILNAACDALSPFDIEINVSRYDQSEILSLINRKK